MNGILHGALEPIFIALGVWVFLALTLLVMWMLLVGAAHSIYRRQERHRSHASPLRSVPKTTRRDSTLGNTAPARDTSHASTFPPSASPQSEGARVVLFDQGEGA